MTMRAAQPMLAGATVSEHEGVRYLHLGTPWVQGAMRLRTPQRLELEYVQRMMAWLLWVDPADFGPGSAVQLGLGAGSITRYCHRVLRMPTVAVEVNATVIDACRLWFRLPSDDATLQVMCDDAARWVTHAAHRGVARFLAVDLYDHDAAAPVLDDAAFYAACRDVLAEGGLATVNLFGRDASFERSVARIAHAFGADQVWHLRPTREGNTIVVAGRGVAVPPRRELLARAAAIEERFGLPARKWLRLVRPYRPGASA
ncbi:MAG: spermidine synthase [Burkholderiaceae bacterium]|jgi:spermidine synthase|nr:spermidine synthase [Burkholderiaceae bacterium]